MDTTAQEHYWQIARNQLGADFDKYTKEQIQEGIDFITYKKVVELPKNECPDKPILYVFRHGQTVDNANFIFSGWRDAELTDNGRKQAHVLAEKMKDKKIGMLIASDQIRAVDTMKLAMASNPFAVNLDIIKDKRLRERCYGDLQGTSKLVAYLKNPEQLKEERRSYTFLPPNGESIEIVCKRVYEVIEEILPKMHEFKINVAVSCHGNSIRGFRRYFEHLNDFDTAHVETPLAQDYAAYCIE
jgi:broad specificity phosphatase PhoE